MGRIAEKIMKWVCIGIACFTAISFARLPLVPEASYSGCGLVIFTFTNPNAFPVEIPAGPMNQLTLHGLPFEGGPNVPTTFMPGRQEGAINVIFNGSNLVWKLKSKSSTANGSKAANTCP